MIVIVGTATSSGQFALDEQSCILFCQNVDLYQDRINKHAKETKELNKYLKINFKH
jgi:hypothetical protein